MRGRNRDRCDICLCSVCTLDTKGDYQVCTDHPYMRRHMCNDALYKGLWEIDEQRRIAIRVCQLISFLVGQVEIKNGFV